MKTDNAFFKVSDKKYHVNLPAELEKNFELLQKIITSLYTGILQMMYCQNDVNFVYKFASDYNVDWLKSKAFSLYENKLTERTFIEIFQFSHLIGCEDLKQLCLDYLTENRFDTVVRTSNLQTIDYICIHTICETESTYFGCMSGMKKFDLICRWVETYGYGPERILHLENLMSLIEFYTFSKSDLATVFDRILQNEHLEEDRRMYLIKEIHKKSKSPIERIPASSMKQLMFKSSQRNLNNIIKSLDQTQSTCYTDKFFINFHEFYSVMENFYQDGDTLTKNALKEFLINNFSTLMSTDKITDLIRLNTKGFNILSIAYSLPNDGSAYLASYIPYIKLKDLPFENFQLFVLKMIERNDFILRFRMVECVMNWALKHPHDYPQVWKLLNKECLCCFPTEYLDLLLKPYVLKITSGKRAPYQCPKHGWKTAFQEKESVVKLAENHSRGSSNCPKYYFSRLTEKTCMMQKETYSFSTNYPENTEYSLKFRHSTGTYARLFQLERQVKSSQLNKTDAGEKRFCNYARLLLFSSYQCMESYPVLASCSLEPQQFREMVAKYSDLCLLIFSDLCGEWSKY